MVDELKMKYLFPSVLLPLPTDRSFPENEKSASPQNEVVSLLPGWEIDSLYFPPLKSLSFSFQVL